MTAEARNISFRDRVFALFFSWSLCTCAHVALQVGALNGFVIHPVEMAAKCWYARQGPSGRSPDGPQANEVGVANIYYFGQNGLCGRPL